VITSKLAENCATGFASQRRGALHACIATRRRIWSSPIAQNVVILSGRALPVGRRLGQRAPDHHSAAHDLKHRVRQDLPVLIKPLISLHPHPQHVARRRRQALAISWNVLLRPLISSGRPCRIGRMGVVLRVYIIM
jgi:hypothetical protein